MIPHSILRPFIARASKQLDPRCSMQTYHQLANGDSLVARKLLVAPMPTKRWPGWVDLGGWLHTEMVYPLAVDHPSK